MKFKVFKKWAWALIPATVLYNLCGLFIITIAAFDQQKEATFVMIYIIAALIILNVFFFSVYITLVSSVIFESDAVRCSFLGRTRRHIPYKEINDYGVFLHADTKFIYISKAKLSEVEKNKKAFQLYKKTKNVIVVEYNDEVINFLKENIVL